MAQDEQRARLQRLRDARQSGAVRTEPMRGTQPYDPYAPLNGSAQARSGHRGALVFLLIVCVLAAAAIGGIGYVFNQFHSAVGGPKRAVRFVVKPGESVGTIASDLERQGLVSNSLVFQLYFRLNGGAGQVQEGPHILTTAMSMDQIAQQLQILPPAPPPANTFQCCTFLPGKRAEEIAQLLQKYGVTSAKDFMHEVQYGQFNYWFLKGRPAGSSLEGFLYPGHYTVTKHYSAHKLVGRMLAAFGRYFTTSMHAEAAQQHRSVYEIVTIASIVQRESSLLLNQRYIASVYYNRLTNVDEVNMRLDADPTVQYALGYRPQEKTWWERHLDQTMIQQVTDSPYNTYTHQGLPPGPIANPGQDALMAALHPAKSQFLYFEVYKSDGKTHFCTTLACQNEQQGVVVHR
jgi:UPF0755 protein